LRTIKQRVRFRPSSLARSFKMRVLQRALNIDARAVARTFKQS
jgi:hypothetical protein